MSDFDRQSVKLLRDAGSWESARILETYIEKRERRGRRGERAKRLGLYFLAIMAVALGGLVLIATHEHSDNFWVGAAGWFALWIAIFIWEAVYNRTVRP